MGPKIRPILPTSPIQSGAATTTSKLKLPAWICSTRSSVPTISAGEFVAEKAKIDNYFPEIVRPKAASVGPQIGDTFNKAYKRGVKIAFGTDAGVQAHGTNWKEFVYMVKFGMPAIETIQSATISTAQMLGIDSTLGSIEVGKMQI